MKKSKLSVKVERLIKRLKERVIAVTQKHIDNGERESTDECPVALAMSAIFKPYGVEVDRGKDGVTVTIEDKVTVGVWATLPKQAAKWTTRYDESDEEEVDPKIKPIKFRLTKVRVDPLSLKLLEKHES